MFVSRGSGLSEVLLHLWQAGSSTQSPVCKRIGLFLCPMKEGKPMCLVESIGFLSFFAFFFFLP